MDEVTEGLLKLESIMQREGNTRTLMTLILLKIFGSLLLVALGSLLTMGPKLPEGYEDELGFHYGTLAGR